MTKSISFLTYSKDIFLDKLFLHYINMLIKNIKFTFRLQKGKDELLISTLSILHLVLNVSEHFLTAKKDNPGFDIIQNDFLGVAFSLNSLDIQAQVFLIFFLFRNIKLAEESNRLYRHLVLKYNNNKWNRFLNLKLKKIQKPIHSIYKKVKLTPFTNKFSGIPVLARDNIFTLNIKDLIHLVYTQFDFNFFSYLFDKDLLKSSYGLEVHINTNKETNIFKSTLLNYLTHYNIEYKK